MDSIGIDLDSEIINIAIVNKHKKIIDFKYFDERQMSISADVKPLYIPSNQKTTITSGLEIQDVLIKNIPFNIKKSFLFKKAIKFENEFITQIDPSKTLTATILLKNESQLKFFITTKDLLTKHLNRLNNLKIDPDYISCSGMALCRFTSHFFNDIKNAFLIHIGQNKTSCVFMKNKFPEKMHTIKIGLNDLENDLLDKKTKKQIQIDTLTIKHNTKIYETLLELKMEITKAFNSFANEKYPLLITGNTENILNIEKFLENEKTIFLLNNDQLEKNKRIKSQAISIGLALNAFSKESQIIQFRNHDFTSTKKTMNYGKKIFIFSIFILMLLITFYYAVSSIIFKKEKCLHQNLMQIYEIEKKELNIDKNMDISNLYDDIDNYEKRLLNETKDFPYFLKTPNVSETLSWINNNELLKNAEIISFNYELEKYPKILDQKQKYIAKVELEFKTKTAAIARIFYDSLIKGEGLVNSKEEIRWDATNDRYKTSFYLKTFNEKK